MKWPEHSGLPPSSEGKLINVAAFFSMSMVWGEKEAFGCSLTSSAFPWLTMAMLGKSSLKDLGEGLTEGA